MDGCTSASTTFSSPTSVCVVFVSTKCCSTILSSSNLSMNTRCTNVAPSPICSLARQFLLLLRKNSTIDVLVLYISWIIIYANYIFSFYVFAHSEDDGECNSNFTANSWIFNTPSFFALFNYSSAFVLLNNFASSSCLCLCSLFCASFSFVIFYNFSIAYLHSCYYEL